MSNIVMTPAYEAGKGNIVLSLAGHDKGIAFYVTGVTENGLLLLADGKTRRVEKPKQKKQKHCKRLSAEVYEADGNAEVRGLLRKFLSEEESDIG